MLYNRYMPISINNSLLIPPSFEEWMTHVRNSPNNKAAGTSGISYEMIKHLGLKTQQFLWKFVSDCITTTFIPDEWREAFVYPIPKPKEWECELTNTRPITLWKQFVSLWSKF